MMKSKVQIVALTAMVMGSLISVANAATHSDIGNLRLTYSNSYYNEYATSNGSFLIDFKLLADAQDDAIALIASNGEIHGANLEAALTAIREVNPELSASTDLELAEEIINSLRK